MLEKYKKLAHDASLNDDRVQTEYYLQFADHYFRVLADLKAQRDEARPRRDGERDQSSDEEDTDYDRDDRRDNQRARSNRNRDDDGDAQDDDRDDDRSDDSRNDNSRSDNARNDDGPGEDGVESADGDDSDDNPFVRDARKRRPRTRARVEANEGAPVSDGVDPGVLPPSISKRDDGDEARKPLRARSRRSRAAEDGDDEALEVVN